MMLIKMKIKKNFNFFQFFLDFFCKGKELFGEDEEEFVEKCDFKWPFICAP